MGKSSPPSPPDPYATSAAQAQMNQQLMEEQQAASQTGQFTPYGSLQYEQTGVGPGGVPVYSGIQQLSPEEQAKLNQLQFGQLESGAAGAGLMNNSMGMYASGIPNFIGGADNMTNQMMGHEAAFLNPQFNDQKSWLDNQMRNQGIMPGTPAYDSQMRNLLTTQNQSMSGFLAQAEPMAFQQAVQQYTIPGQEAQQLLGFGAPQSLTGSYVNTPGASGTPTNLSGNVNANYQAQIQAFQAQQSQQNSMMQGIGTLAMAAMMFL